jgi:hypothetical protein
MLHVRAGASGHQPVPDLAQRSVHRRRAHRQKAAAHLGRELQMPMPPIAST